MSSLLSTTTKGPPYSWHHSRQNSYRAFMKLFYLFIWLLWVLVVAHGISVSTMQIFRCKALALELCYLGSVVAPCGLSCSEACRISLPLPEIKHLFPAIQGRHLIPWLEVATSLKEAIPSCIYLTFYIYLIILGLIILKIGHINISPTQYRKFRQREIQMSFPCTCFSWTRSESSPSGMVTMLCWASRSVK